MNAAWKLPLGYFPIYGCKAEQKYTITKFCIEKILSVGVDLIGITFDGCPANIIMAKMFGCEINSLNFIPTFNLKDGPYEGKTFIINIDPCHAVKLVRNAFAKKIIKIDVDVDIIDWTLQEKLVELEQEELHLGNQLSRADIEFKSTNYESSSRNLINE